MHIVKSTKIGPSWKCSLFLLSCQEGLGHQGSNLPLTDGKKQTAVCLPVQQVKSQQALKAFLGHGLKNTISPSVYKNL